MEIHEIKRTHPTDSQITEHNKICDRLKNISRELKNSITGLENLKITYHEDATIVSKLEIMIEKIEITNDDIKTKLDRFHYKNHGSANMSANISTNISTNMSDNSEGDDDDEDVTGGDLTMEMNDNYE